MPPWFPSSDPKRTSLLPTVADLGLILTLMLTLIDHHCKLIVYHLRNIARIWPRLAIKYIEKLVHWFKHPEMTMKHP